MPEKTRRVRLSAANEGKTEFPNYGIKLSHHEKRTLAWKILLCMFCFFGIMLYTGLVHYFLGFTDPVKSLLVMAIGWVAIAMFGIGYLVRDRLPRRMGIKCKRFSFMGVEFGIWHWTRAQIYLADIFLTSLASAVLAWCLSHTIPMLIIGTPMDTFVPIIHIPILYTYFWIEIVGEIVFSIVTVFAFIYELKTWILGRSGDFCFFEGASDWSEGLDMDCDPRDPDCHLNKNFE